MPFCPECQAEFREGFTRCNTCDVELVVELPEAYDLSEENIHRALRGKQLIPVTRGYLDVVKENRELLAAHRIASLIVEDEAAQDTAGAPKRVVLVVDKDDQGAATEVLGESFLSMVSEEGLSAGREGQRVDRKVAFNQCPACGHAVAEDEEECPECGLFIGKG